jgi:hypothetical protein
MCAPDSESHALRLQSWQEAGHLLCLAFCTCALYLCLLCTPPLLPACSYIAVTVALYGSASLVVLHFSGVLGDETEGMLVGPLLMMSAAVTSLAAGLPIWMLPAPLLAAAGMTMFYESRLLRDYFIFAAAAGVTGEQQTYPRVGERGKQNGMGVEMHAAVGCAQQLHSGNFGATKGLYKRQRTLSTSRVVVSHPPFCHVVNCSWLVHLAPFLVPGYQDGGHGPQDSVRIVAFGHRACAAGTWPGVYQGLSPCGGRRAHGPGELAEEA